MQHTFRAELQSRQDRGPVHLHARQEALTRPSATVRGCGIETGPKLRRQIDTGRLPPAGMDKISRIREARETLQDGKATAKSGLKTLKRCYILKAWRSRTGKNKTHTAHIRLARVGRMEEGYKHSHKGVMNPMPACRGHTSHVLGQIS